jgi:hypothetical protein
MKLLHVLLIPVLAAAQADPPQLSEAARKLLRKPRSGNARLTFSDGKKVDGQVLWVTDQFVTFQTRTRLSCEDVEWSRVADVRWLGTPIREAVTLPVAYIWVGIFTGPFYIGNIIANVFRRISPPLRPPGGRWESVGDGGKSSLDFKGSTVHSRATIITHGRYSVAGDRLRMMPDGKPDSVVPFHIICRHLTLESVAGSFSYFGAVAPHHVAAPIVAEWNGPNSNLTFEPDGSFKEQKGEIRDGTFVRTATGVNIHWSDGQDWSAQIEHRHIVIRAGGVVTEYRYVPPGLEWGP